METHLQVVLMIVVAMLASFMATIRFLLSRRRANCRKRSWQEHDAILRLNPSDAFALAVPFRLPGCHFSQEHPRFASRSEDPYRTRTALPESGLPVSSDGRPCERTP